MEMLTVRELAISSGWPISRIRRLARTRRLAHVQIDGITLLPVTAIEDFLQQNLILPEGTKGGRPPCSINPPARDDDAWSDGKVGK